MKTAFFRVLLLALPLAAALGCGPAGLTRVSGKVTLDGQPLSGAMVQFIPEEGGNPANGVTGSDGSFRLSTYSTGDGARPGTYKVLVQLVDENAAGVAPPDPSDPKGMMDAMKKFKESSASKKKGKNLPATYSDPKKSTLKQVVPPTGEVLLELRSTGG